jgi:hypothetical protein
MIKTFEYSEKQFKAAKVPIDIVPTNLSTMRLPCNRCKKTFKPNWLESRYLKSNLNFNMPTEKYWKRLDFTFNCPICHEGVSWEIKELKPTGVYHFYGDEAYRDTKTDFKVIAFSFIGSKAEDEAVLQKALYAIKKDILPTENPATWILHLSDIYSAPEKKKLPIFKGWNAERKLKAIEIAQNHISTLPEDVVKISSVGIAANRYSENQKVFEKRLKKQVFWNHYIQILDLASENCVIPKYFLESDSKDGWGNIEFIGLKYTPLFVELSRGNIIEPPYFNNKSPNGLEQLADVLAFVTAREAQKYIDKEECNVSTKRFGKIKWFGFDSYGEPCSKFSEGYPWADFHNIKAR